MHNRVKLESKIDERKFVDAFSEVADEKLSAHGVVHNGTRIAAKFRLDRGQANVPFSPPLHT